MKRVVVLFFPLLLVVAAGCGAPLTESSSSGTDSAGLDHLVQESWTNRIALTDSGVRRGIVEAGHGAEYRTRSGSEHHLDGGIRVTLFDAKGRPATIITAQKAVIHENQDIEAMGKVVMTSAEKTVITTEYVTTSAKEKMIRSDRFVTITRPGETIRGEGFESDQALKKYRIFRGSGEAFIQQ